MYRSVKETEQLGKGVSISSNKSKSKNGSMAVVSKMYCSASEAILVVRRRPHVVYGGGFVVTDCTTQKVVFRVDGCGVLGREGELVLRDGPGHDLLLIRRKGGIIEALNVNRHWKGYKVEYQGAEKLVFTLKEPNSCLVKNNPITISTAQGNFEIRGYFPDKACTIVDSSTGNLIAQIGTKKKGKEEELGMGMMGHSSKDVYYVVVKGGIDQAFVFGIIAVLDYIYDGSTRC